MLMGYSYCMSFEGCSGYVSTIRPELNRAQNPVTSAIDGGISKVFSTADESEPSLPRYSVCSPPLASRTVILPICASSGSTGVSFGMLVEPHSCRYGFGPVTVVFTQYPWP